MVIIFQFIVLIFSVMVHEVSHGIVAYKLGDDTAKTLGRLNFNPLKHLDPMGSVILPVFLLLMNSPILFGWAKPVPYNPNNLKNPKKGAALIALAGPMSNLALAVIFGVLIQILGPFADNLGETVISLLQFFNVIVFINVLLAVFNLVPIPPLDGSKLIFAMLPPRYYRVQRFLEQYGMFLLIFFIFFGFGIIIPVISGLYHLLTAPFSIF
ncbi:MAG: hypothetical protein A3H63_01790 [Candidatus Harrisonbacteria bacterium RIFCSPLOWO2_02_FULL_45_10c]|uniref:Peptidase M50 domain-containing protein n=1 Tax=Candidatus Harrisonbacteria bacterium RIFCSPLOWO2_02_FULL_45_10c TaxID=1798410 RepID=A0A1G1ZW36_9BACT|nr:MAG: hypothetical protein A3H63_01790 [Candidatus Harrisonbacteria bacterium RIFCSPLOWO2_02_FULL_45_10c]